MTAPLLPVESNAPQPSNLHPDIEAVLVSEQQIADKVRDLAAQVDRDYAGCEEVILVGVLKGAVMVMADLARALTVP
ncbi:MAG TPA: phosphoribosyltransferase family protein, partial [Mycobacteriales bacterium]|nr:phosphoribosyltransferase family protein [Mycobacteriales bacterium]